MLECLVLGDSIAVGVSQVRRECITYAKSGINSSLWNRDYLPHAVDKKYKTVVISLGANDHKGIPTENELRRMRVNVSGKRVFWIDPGKDRKPIAHDAIMRIASQYGDTILARPKDQMSADGIHPTGRGYQTLANQTR
jgi:lysophospholipase L1-like esterase